MSCPLTAGDLLIQLSPSQSETLGLQIGLSLLEIVVGALFPELRGLLGEIGLLGGSGRSAAVHAKRPQ